MRHPTAERVTEAAKALLEADPARPVGKGGERLTWAQLSTAEKLAYRKAAAKQLPPEES